MSKSIEINTSFDESQLPTETEVERDAKKAGDSTFGIFKVAPIERKKFFLMALQFFFICFIYAVLRELKDTFTLSRQLPASIAVLKLAYVPPVSIIASTIIQKLLTFTNNKNILMVLLVGYAIYFFSYGLIILPLQEKLEPSTFLAGDKFSDEKMVFFGVQSSSALVVTVTCWTSTLHFIASEIWGSAILSLLFLSFANDVCPFKQYIRFMPLFYIFSNLALIFSFATIQAYTAYNKTLSYAGTQWLLRSFFCFLGVLSIFTIVFGSILSNTVLNKPLYIIEGDKKKKKKAKMSFTEGIKLMFKSKLVLAICGMTLAYNVGTNMLESCYKTALGVWGSSGANTDAASIMSFLSYTQVIVGAAVILLLITPFSSLIQKFGWLVLGLMPPIAAAIGFFSVFCFAIYNTSLMGTNFTFLNNLFFTDDLDDGRKNSLLKYEVFTGLIFASLFKIAKYAAFDIAKETISMRINVKYRARFKGIYDGVCGKLGKAGGALLQLICNQIANTTDIRNSSLLYLIISCFIVLIWVLVVAYLAVKYDESIKNDKDIDIDLFAGNKGLLDEDDNEVTKVPAN